MCKSAKHLAGVAVTKYRVLNDDCSMQKNKRDNKDRPKSVD